MTGAVTDAQRTIVEALNRGDASGVRAAFRPDCRVHLNGGPKRDLTLAELEEALAGMLAASSDLRFTAEDQFVSGDRVATRWTARGTHDGPLGPIAATGKAIVVEGMIIDHYVDGRIAERWELWDQAWVLQQVGVL